LPSESGIVLAKYFTFSTAASVSARSGFGSVMPVGSEPVGSGLIGSELGAMVEDIPTPLISSQRKQAAAV
jgi:hypothetical protein